MNPKVLNLIAAELGILIGITSWLAYSRLQSPEHRTAAEMRESSLAPVTTGAPAFEPRNQRPSPVDYEPDRERAQPVEEQPEWAQVYYRSIARQPYGNSVPDNGSVAVDSPSSYGNVNQEPEAAPADYLEAPQTVAYPQAIQNVLYAQPIQIVEFSNSRRFANRCQSRPGFNAYSTVPHQCPDRRNPHPNNAGLVSPPNANPPPSPPAQGPRPRETVRHPVGTGGQQSRMTFPVSPRSTQRVAP